MIGDDIRIVLIEIRGDKVRLGIEAPATTKVHRLEVYEAIKAREAAEADAAADEAPPAPAPTEPSS